MKIFKRLLSVSKRVHTLYELHYSPKLGEIKSSLLQPILGDIKLCAIHT